MNGQNEQKEQNGQSKDVAPYNADKAVDVNSKIKKGKIYKFGEEH